MYNKQATQFMILPVIAGAKTKIMYSMITELRPLIIEIQSIYVLSNQR